MRWFTCFSWVVIAVLLAAAAGCGQPEPLRFSVRLEDAGQLSQGSPLVFREGEIGQVSSVRRMEDEWVIRVEVDPQHRKLVYREVQFSIAEDSRGRSYLQADDVGDDRTPIEEGDVIDARPGWFQRLSRGLEELRTSTRQVFADAREELTDAVDSFQDSPEFKAFKELLAEAGQDVASVARSRYGRFVKEDLPKLEARAEAYRDKLQREGRTTEAEIFWKWFQRWADTVRGSNPEADSEPLKPEKEPPR